VPKRTDIHKILLIGSGPIVIGQACEFDYSGTQACKALREEGYELVLVNSNPATIMTDPEMSDRTYIEPIVPSVLEKILEKEKPDAILPTLGGQTALNCAVTLSDSGALKRHGVELIGANADVIRKAEDRQLFKEAILSLGLEVPKSGTAHSAAEAGALREQVGLPCVVRPSFTLGGTGGGIAYNVSEFERVVDQGLKMSMIGEVLVEASVIGWKEFELEVMRDRAGNGVIVCSIENFDPMGVHTGDSITVAPAQTLTDLEYQRMRDAALAIMNAIGVACGGSNIQFAVSPTDGRMVVIEMNPRVSRSSALASKATGFPIARIAAKLAVGYTLDEIPNDITRKTPSCFEPVQDYVVVKIPRWAFEKFPEIDATLGIQMKSVGEVMAIGRTFPEALQKAVRSLEGARAGFEPDGAADIRSALITPNRDRLYTIRRAMETGVSLKEIHELTRIDPWFLDQLAGVYALEKRLAAGEDVLREAKRVGFGDRQIARILKTDEAEIRRRRHARGIVPAFKLVDTCSAEFESFTPYYYSTYDDGADESPRTAKKKVVVIGGGSNRIGQGIEFDYCCVHASMALRELGYESVMINCNPETVSTDYDISDHLFFEPITEEDVIEICRSLKPEGVIVQLGGQTPLNLAHALERAGQKILGTSVDQIDRAEDRGRFYEMLDKLGLSHPPGGMAAGVAEARTVAESIGYPVLIRPSYVLGGRAMKICYDEEELVRLLREGTLLDERQFLIDKFLEDAIEVDVDALCDGQDVLIGGILEHIEMAGVHSGDATMTLPPHTLSEAQVDRIRAVTEATARELQVKGLLNLQLAVKDRTVWVLEVNPRASRTVPFVSKAVGVPLAKVATRVMMGAKLADLKIRLSQPGFFSVKASVFPFQKFAGADIILGPEMKSTGEVMGIDPDLGLAYAKAHMAALPAASSRHSPLPTSGNVFISVKDKDKRDAIGLARRLEAAGFKIFATSGTATALERNGIAVRRIFKLTEGRPNPLDLVINGELDLIINTPSGKGPKSDEARIRSAAIAHNVMVLTTLQGADAAVHAIETLRRRPLVVRPLQEYHPTAGRSA
jgi:carbamoyl-phosphate synthase large subunit